MARGFCGWGNLWLRYSVAWTLRYSVAWQNLCLGESEIQRESEILWLIEILWLLGRDQRQRTGCLGGERGQSGAV